MQAVFGYEALVAKIPGASERTFRRMVAQGSIPHRRLSGKLIVFDVDAVQRALLSTRGEPEKAGR
jgi:hypothetical protein